MNKINKKWSLTFWGYLLAIKEKTYDKNIYIKLVLEITDLF